jgi:hypothetical protein
MYPLIAKTALVDGSTNVTNFGLETDVNVPLIDDVISISLTNNPIIDDLAVKQHVTVPGAHTVGDLEGLLLGLFEGLLLGLFEGLLLGLFEGLLLGLFEGLLLGLFEGDLEGLLLGLFDGDLEGD